jgi:hypothetical protein
MALASTALLAAPAETNSPEAIALRNTVGQAVCAVTVENQWGIPVAVSTGFLLGDGRFAITDLGAVAQPGVARATLLFSDGTMAEARQFGLADPALGLVALRVKSRTPMRPNPAPRGEEQPTDPAESETPLRPGLALAPALPPLETTGLVTAMGWRYGKQLEWVAGRVTRGPAIKEIAMRAHVETPTGVDAFLKMDGNRIDAASGSPVFDASGSVLAVRLEVQARDLSLALAIPAPSIRQALMGAPAELKALSAIPKPFWPAQILRVKGEPPTVAEFTRATQVIKDSLVCKACNGKGKAAGGFLHRMMDGNAPCPVCQGDGIAIQEGVYSSLTQWAERGVQAVWAPTVDDRSRTAVRSSAFEIMRALATSHPNVRRMLGFAGLGDIMRPGVMPRGAVFFARVRDIVDGPDGRYLILDASNPPWDMGGPPWPRGPGGRDPGPGDPGGRRTRTLDAPARDAAGGVVAPPPEPPRPPADRGFTVALRAVDVAALAKGPAGNRREPEQGAWIVVAGSAVSGYRGGEYNGLAVLPLEWLPAPLPPPVRPRP